MGCNSRRTCTNRRIGYQALIRETEEVQDIRWFEIDDMVKMIDNNYDGITDKKGCWRYLKRYLQNKK